LGIVTGTISGLVVLDVDGDEGKASLAKHFPQLPPTPVALTGKGMHNYFKHPGKHVANGVRILPGLDVRADGGYVVAPPSVHVTGAPYRWGLSPDDEDLAPTPHAAVQHSSNIPAAQPPALPIGVSAGQRNTIAARLAGRFFCRGFTMAEVLHWLRLWNQTNTPPLEDEELSRVVQSIGRRESRRLLGYP
jgi:hypothetical protein